MSNQTVVLYGNRLYDNITYSSNQDPQTFSASLSDSTSLTDARILDTITQLLADIQALIDTRLFSSQKILADTENLSENLIKLLNHSFSDSISLSDSEVLLNKKVLQDTISALESIITTIGIKALLETLTLTESRFFQTSRILLETLVLHELSITVHESTTLADFTILNEWLSLKLNRANIWTSKSASETVNAILEIYDKSLYDKPLYSGMAGIDWIIPNNDSATWINPPIIVTVPQLYGKMLYSKLLYGSIPSLTWIIPPTNTENFTNFDGQGNVP